MKSHKKCYISPIWGEASVTEPTCTKICT